MERTIKSLNYSSKWKLCLLLALASLIAPMAFGQSEAHKWTNKSGRTINAQFIKGDAETVTILTGERTFVVKLSTLKPESQALARRLTVAAAPRPAVESTPTRQPIAKPASPTAPSHAAEPLATAKAEIQYSVIFKGGQQITTPNGKVKLQLKGPQAQSAYSIGPVTAAPITVDGQVVQVQPDDRASDGFSLIDRSKEGFFAQHPKDGIGFTVNYGKVPDKPTSIESVKGSVMVLTGGKEQVVSLRDILKHPNGPIKDPILSAAGLSLTLEQRALGKDVQLDVGMKVGSVGFAGFNLLDPAGKPIRLSSSGSGTMDGLFLTYINERRELLKGATLQLLVRTGSKQVVLPFKVEHVPFN